MIFDIRFVKGAEFRALIFVIAFMALLAGCKGSRSSVSQGSDLEGEIEMKYASNLKINEADDYTLVTIRNPWDTTKTLQRYILVDRDKKLPASLPEGRIVRVPVANALVYSTVHNSLIEELGAIDAIGGICNSKYLGSENLKKRIAAGKVADCGMSVSPDLERVIKLNPDVIMLSAFEKNDESAKVEELGIPIVECADYMENSPLGRAEWIRFYGLLFGKRDVSERMFEDTKNRYNELKTLASKTAKHPKVLMDQRYGQVWYVPTANSTTGMLIEDAGGKNPFSEFKQSGSVPLAPEKVLAMAHDADVWFVRFNQDKDKSLKELANDASINSQFGAYRSGNVYGCNTKYKNLFDDSAFHPDRLLEDFILIIHPEVVIPDSKQRYYHKMR